MTVKQPGLRRLDAIWFLISILGCSITLGSFIDYTGELKGKPSNYQEIPVMMITDVVYK